MEIYEKHQELIELVKECQVDIWAAYEADDDDVFTSAETISVTQQELWRSGPGKRLVLFSKIFRACMNPGPGCVHTEEDHNFMLWALDNPAAATQLLEGLR